VKAPTGFEASAEVVRSAADTLLTAVAAMAVVQGIEPTVSAVRKTAIAALDGVIAETASNLAGLAKP
jgi:hypothetical protein